MKSCELVRPDLALYARGLLSAPEHEIIESHLEQCAACAEDAAFSFELEQSLRLESSDSMEPVLSPDFTGRVMRAIGAGSTARVMPLRPVRLSWTVLAAAAGLLAVISLAFRGAAPSSRGAAGDSHARVVAEVSDGNNGVPMLAQLKAALDVCAQPTSASSSRAGWSSDRDLFGDASDGASATPRQDPFFLNDPYATLFSDMLPRYTLVRS